VLRFVQGLAGAAGIVIARAVVRDLYSGREAARFFSLLMLVNGAAPILAPVLGGQVLTVTSWRGVFVVLAVIGVLLLAGTATGVPETLAAERRHAGGVAGTLRTFGRLLADRGFLGHALACGLCFGAMFAYIAGSPFVLQDIYGASPQLFSVMFAVNALGIVAATSSTGRSCAASSRGRSWSARSRRRRSRASRCSRRSRPAPASGPSWRCCSSSWRASAS
jgi:MFS transporter, DHA1 family, multidrug resistance protein